MNINYRNQDYIKISDRVELDWRFIWYNKGHALGEGMVSPDQKYFYLNIPKNSSSFIKDRLSEIGWEHSNIEDYHHDIIPIIALRDPIKRWVSGIAEYLFMYQLPTIDSICEPFTFDFYPLIGERLGLGLIFDRITFDDHTERQCVFLHHIKSLENCIWVRSDNNFNHTFAELIRSLGYENNFEDYPPENSSDGTERGTLAYKKKALTEMFQYIIDNDNFKKYNLEQWFWCDYELIKKVGL